MLGAEASMSMSPSGPFERLPDLRIGDREREAAAQSLGEHFAAGRLDPTELEERLSAVYSARTQADIDRLFADLPDPRRPLWDRSQPGPPPGPQHPAGWPFPVPILLALVLFGLTIVTRGAILLPVAMIWLWSGLGRCHARGDGPTGRGGWPGSLG
jgi:hypothetical protein